MIVILLQVCTTRMPTFTITQRMDNKAMDSQDLLDHKDHLQILEEQKGHSDHQLHSQD